MSTKVIVGAQWGDEGKGKVVDLFTEFVDIVVRFQGGNNAGHTLVVEDDQGEVEETVLHLVPSGILHPDKRCVIASGVVLDPSVLIDEIEALEERGYLDSSDQLSVASDASLVLPYHRALDSAREEAADQQTIGTTGRGIGPCYEDRVGRRAIFTRDLLDEASLRAKLEQNLSEKNRLLEGFGAETFEADALADRLLSYGQRLEPYIDQVDPILERAIERGDDVLFEGAQGTMLDIGKGTYPYVTSSHTTSGGACVGAGVAPRDLDGVVGVTKAYCTRVGQGPFPTELDDEVGRHLRQAGDEFGSTTGRPRRCGWVDAAALRHAVRINGFSGLAVTKLDILTGLDTVRIGTGYRGPDGETYSAPVPDAERYAEFEPIYEELPGWDEDVTGVRVLEDLPTEARRFIDRLETLLEVPIALVSVGPQRGQTIVVENIYR